MKIRVFALLIVVSLLLAGCTGGGLSSGSETVSVTWRYERDSVQSLTVNSIDSHSLEPEYTEHTNSALGWGWLIAEAKVHGRSGVQNDKPLEFQIQSKNSYTVEDNKVIIIPDIAEDGHVLVRYGDTEVISPFRIYQAVAIGSEYEANRDIHTHYDFEIGESLESGDLYMVPGSTDIWTTHGYAVMKKANSNSFLGVFQNSVDFESLDYQEGSFSPDYDKLYVIKTSNGYAKIIFSSWQTSWNRNFWNFIYDYTPNKK